jgi:hypothetical protein
VWVTVCVGKVCVSVSVCERMRVTDGVCETV